MMRFVSTTNKKESVSFRDAVMGGMNSAGGLYMPVSIPRLPATMIDSMPARDYVSVATDIISPFSSEDIPANDLGAIISDAFNFPVRLSRQDDAASVLELYHGPSCAFKDFGARFMARTMSWFAKKEGRHIHVIVATSGDTGGAVGAAFQDVPGFSVTILYPTGRISPLQEKQLSSFSGNVQPVAVSGSFDDCQRLVKQAFTDADLRARMELSSANSINIARLVPQASYYAWASSRVAETGKASGQAWTERPYSIFVVPSGNFGNLTAGIFARLMGCPIDHFIAATNANRTVPDYFANGKYEPRVSIPTISNAMDVGAPSNFERMADLYSLDEMKSFMSAYSVSDEDTRKTLKSHYAKSGYILEPHGAVGWKAWTDLADKLRAQSFKDAAFPLKAIILETADPAKFSEVIKEELGIDPPMPPQLEVLLSRPSNAISMKADYVEFKQLLLDRKS